MTNILILLDHPQYDQSKANRAMIDALQGLQGVRIIDICDTPVAPQAYEDAIKEADVIIFQFPMWWMSAPAPLQQWLDTLMIGFRESGILKGKRLMCATTTGAPEAGYTDSGRDGDYTVTQLFYPFHAIAAYCDMQYLPPFALYGAGTPQADELIQKGAREYRMLLEDL